MTDDLRHFPSQDPPPKEGKADQSLEIASHVQEFLRTGGEIRNIDQSESASKHEPVRRTRQDSLEYMRRRHWKARNKE